MKISVDFHKRPIKIALMSQSEGVLNCSDCNQYNFYSVFMDTKVNAMVSERVFSKCY